MKGEPMPYSFRLMTEADADIISEWRYEAPYDTYNMSDNPEEEAGSDEMLERRSPYYAVRDERDELIGFFCYGTAGQPFGTAEPGLYTDDRSIVLGLGLRPDLTGKGLGPSFVEAGLDFARQQFAPRAFLLYVMAFNQRAIRVYEKAGFSHIRVYMQQNIHGTHEFLVMRREE